MRMSVITDRSSLKSWTRSRFSPSGTRANFANNSKKAAWSGT